MWSRLNWCVGSFHSLLCGCIPIYRSHSGRRAPGRCKAWMAQDLSSFIIWQQCSQTINENKTLSIMIGHQCCHFSLNATSHLLFDINVVIYHLITIHCLIFSFTWLSVLKEHASRRWDGASRNWNFWFLRLLRRIPGFAPNATYWQQRVLKENYRLNICRRKPIGVQSINLELDWEQLWQFATTSESGIRMICYSTEVKTIYFSGSSS